MTLYFDTKVQFLDSEAISTVSCWHPNEPIFAVASYSNERGGSVTIFDDAGIPLRNITYPVHSTSQATVLTWHPEKKILLSGWENGEIHAWYEGKRDFTTINGPHKSPIMLLEFSEKGGRVVTADAMGVLTGWRYDGHGQFLTLFHHELRDPLLHITFRRSIESASNRELTNLAKAAVAGDEAALDTLTTWRPRTAVRNLAHSSSQDNYCFYACTQAGFLYYINQQGTCTEIVRGDSIPIIQILWHPKQDSIVLLLEDITIGHYEVDGNGQITELDRVKLSGSVKVSGYKSAITWVAGVGAALAILTGDLSVRIWDIESNDNYVLSMELVNGVNVDGNNAVSRAPAVEVFTCVAYCKENQTLSAGTNQGNLYAWRRLNVNRSYDYPENQWQLSNVTPVRGTIKSLTWGITDTNRPCMMVNCLSSVFILKEQPLLAGHTRNLWATQKKSNQLALVSQNSLASATSDTKQRKAVMKSDNSIIHLALSEINLVVTNGRTVAIYRVGSMGATGGGSSIVSSTTGIDEDANTLSITHVGSFGVDCVAIYLYEQSVVALGAEHVKIYSLSGVVLQEIFFNDNEGKPIGADLLGQYLTVFTLNGYIKLFDISRHELKLVQPPKCAYDLFEKFGEIISAKSNSTGTYLALTIANEQLLPDGKLYLWNLESNIIQYYEFSSKLDSDSVIPHLPVVFFWDTDDPRMLVCETKPIYGSGQKVTGKAGNIPESQINIMFVDQKTQLKELEVIELNSGDQLINLCIPHVVLLKLNQIEHIPLRDFKGMEHCDVVTRNMVLNFSLNVAQENMDQAFSCIRSLKSDTVWTNLAKLCVHTGRLDVAKVCLGHLMKARSVRALRKAMEDTTLEHECRVAVLAIELNMIPEAESLYKQVGRYDLLNKLYQAAGRFDEALEIAENLDRVHLKNTYYKYAEWLKENGKTQKAIQYYEKTNTLMHNVSQLLMDDPASLKKYMQTTKDPELLKWWAQYIESSGDMEGAFKIYQKSEDWFSQVRILCFIGQIGKADEIARNSKDRAACYHLARYYENSGKFSEAIQFYTRAETYGNAVRICKENDLQDDLWTVACTARPRDKASAAAYFEENGDYRRAVELYHRAGMLHKAVEMAFKSQQPESLQVIASELDASSDPELVGRCADFFIGVEQNYKAVQLLASARQLERALKVAAEHSVPLTETLAELLTPTKNEIPEESRVALLLQLGEMLQEQGDYHSATKKFTQAGDKIRAMKSLLKSGDTEKIIFFAGMSRQKEVYVMAANYLQALSWQSDSKILKNIVTFYTKGQAYNQLANFYANCAQAEIDEFRDYDKALKALQEAGKCLSRAQPPSQKTTETLQQAVMEVRKFIDLQDAVERREFLSAIKILKVKLEDQVAPPVRIWDLLALLVECLVSTSQYSEGLFYLKQLAQKKLDWYQQELIEKSLLDKLVAETGINLEPYANPGRVQRPLTSSTVTMNSDDEEIQEEFED
ncbi:intraflagellar transport protein 140 homolog [Topomyia yanbarensis]|uniref:intraflagellar transport protein 140 homolog n=1 Tax=Topomyia yanbarensis TaxID=2498891 RepID=UPI00273AD20E|nr:intraflagellar transport protein 140 homolog [Topomyia yanbarensis]XP_058813921.1 intraflagellar transport protein 140 homolog [Topomyia yanbarensis]